MTVPTITGRAVPGSLLDAAYPSLERFRLARLWNPTTSRDFPCFGCGIGVRAARRGGARRRWCDHCLPIAKDMRVIRSAAEKFVRYGLPDAAAAAEKALESLRVAMRAGAK